MMIDLTGDDSDDDEVMMFTQQPLPTGGCEDTKKFVVKEDPHHYLPTAPSNKRSSEENDEVEVVLKENVVPLKRAKLFETDMGDGECVITGSRGDNALSDFPHSREHCVEHAFGTVAACENCYCYCCDKLVSECSVWATSHYAATHKLPHWRTERARIKREGLTPPPVAAAAVPSRSEQAYPGIPQAWAELFRRQALAQPPKIQRAPAGPEGPPTTIETLLVATAQVYPDEAAEPIGLVLTGGLRHYQKQSLAFMLDLEKGPARSNGMRGGILADEMGMGKTMVLIALHLANPRDITTPTEASWNAILRRSADLGPRVPDVKQSLMSRTAHLPSIPGANASTRRLELKMTVIVMPLSLVGQWQDELKNHAPSLRVGVYHGTNRDRDLERGMSSIDVLLHSVTVELPAWFQDSVSFARVCVDECHIGCKAQKLAAQYEAPLKWALSGTPFTTSLKPLLKVCKWLGLDRSATALPMAVTKYERAGQDNGRATTFLVAQLQKFMIRHTKSQRIAGDAALALPEAASRDILIPSFGNSDEEERYANAKRDRVTPGRLTMMSVEMALSGSRIACSASTTKADALLKDMNAARATQPGFRAVVFSHFSEAIKVIQDKLRKAGYVVDSLSSTTAGPKRHQLIRDFQNNNDPRPRVCLVSMRVGAVGITLTAASHVYICEPSVDPSNEKQAAGRVHRLGQTKPVSICRLVLQNTVEHSIVNLHNAVNTGNIEISSSSAFLPAEAVRLLYEH